MNLQGGKSIVVTKVRQRHVQGPWQLSSSHIRGLEREQFIPQLFQPPMLTVGTRQEPAKTALVVATGGKRKKKKSVAYLVPGDPGILKGYRSDTLSFFFFFLFFLRPHLQHVEVPRPGVQLELQELQVSQPQPHHKSHSHSNTKSELHLQSTPQLTGSLTHWARPGIKPTSILRETVPGP